MSTGVPTYPASIDTNATLGPTLGIVANNTLLGAVGPNQGDQLGITNNLINQVIALENQVGITESTVTTSLVYQVAALQTMVAYVADTGVANAYVVTLTPAPLAYEVGMSFTVFINAANSGASTINVNSLGAIPIHTPGNLALQGGELAATQAVPLVYTGSAFIMTGPCPLNYAVASSTNLQVNCSGYTSIFVSVQFTNTSLSLGLSNLSVGVPVLLLIGNASGSTSAFGLSATNSSGSAVSTVNVLQSGQANGNTFTAFNGYTLLNGYSVLLVGGLFSATVLHFSR